MDTTPDGKESKQDVATANEINRAKFQLYELLVPTVTGAPAREWSEVFSKLQRETLKCLELPREGKEERQKWNQDMQGLFKTALCDAKEVAFKYMDKLLSNGSLSAFQQHLHKEGDLCFQKFVFHLQELQETKMFDDSPVEKKVSTVLKSVPVPFVSAVPFLQMAIQSAVEAVKGELIKEISKKAVTIFNKLTGTLTPEENVKATVTTFQDMVVIFLLGSAFGGGDGGNGNAGGGGDGGSMKDAEIIDNHFSGGGMDTTDDTSTGLGLGGTASDAKRNTSSKLGKSATAGRSYHQPRRSKPGVPPRHIKTRSETKAAVAKSTPQRQTPSDKVGSKRKRPTKKQPPRKKPRTSSGARPSKRKVKSH